MRFSFARAVVTIGALGVAACSSDSATGPDANRTETPSLSAAGTSGPQGHVVKFSTNAVPSGFAARVAALGGTVTSTFGEIGVAAVSGLSDAAAAGLVGSGGVTLAGAIPVIELESPVAVGDAEMVDAAVESQAAPATAFFFPRQWNMRQVRADVAWAGGNLGSATTKVGILDTGLGYTHPDIAGLVDLTLSRSFIPGDDALVAALFPGANPIADLHYHGTHVGATVSSKAIAAAGINSRVTLVGVKVLNVNGSSVGNSVLDGIMYAARPVAEGGAGVDVINMSLGGNFQKKDFPGYVSVINAAINYAKTQGVTMVVSSGNSAFNLDSDGNGYKTYCSAPNVVCVSATGPTAQAGVNGPWTNPDASASYSNIGTSAISVAAPGGNGTSFVYAACSTFSLQIPVCRTGTFVVGVQGTSMASPHVAGLAAMLVPSLGRDPGAIRGKIQQTAIDLGKKGADPLYGKGRIDVGKAMGL